MLCWPLVATRPFSIEYCAEMLPSRGCDREINFQDRHFQIGRVFASDKAIDKLPGVLESTLVKQRPSLARSKISIAIDQVGTPVKEDDTVCKPLNMCKRHRHRERKARCVLPTEQFYRVLHNPFVILSSESFVPNHQQVHQFVV